MKREQEKKNGKERNYKNNWKTINKMAISTHLTIINLNVNGINDPIKIHSVPTRDSLQTESYTDIIKKRGGKRYLMQIKTKRKLG